MEKKLYHGASVMIAWIILAIITICFLPSCTASTSEETKTETTPITKEVKVVDMLETITKYHKGAISVTYVLLENGEVEIIHGKNNPNILPYTKEEAKKIMAFRRGETVTMAIPVE